MPRSFRCLGCPIAPIQDQSPIVFLAEILSLGGNSHPHVTNYFKLDALSTRVDHPKLKTGLPTVILQYWTDCTIGSIDHAGDLQSPNLSDLLIIGIPFYPICQDGPICLICQKIQSCNLPSHPMGDRSPSELQ